MQPFLSSLGPVCAVIGAQWGDEGKGKVIDILAEHFDVLARACGGANAGHTIVVSGKKHVFHLLSAGSLHSGKIIVLGAGMVIHLPTLLEEIATLEEAGVGVRDRLYLAPNAHIVFEYHKAIDATLEEGRSKGGTDIGTTRRGIGPAYTDKAARTGLRLESLRLGREAWERELRARQEHVHRAYGVEIDLQRECGELERARVLLQSRIVEGLPNLLDQFLREGKFLLIEGAQATLLDIDHGTYPYVTSGQTTAAGALQGLGLAPRHLSSCIGVAKAYCTRVGAGNFPTEVTGTTEERLRERGGEYGATTGRPRRCGWLHLPDLLRAKIINGFDCWNITKLDVLDEELEIPVGVGVENGQVTYEVLPGWQTPTSSITAFEALPPKAQDFIRFIEERTEIPVRLIGTGQGREDIIIR